MSCWDQQGFSKEEIAEFDEAREILSWRPGLQPRALPGKGGPKFFGRTGAILEENKVDTQLGRHALALGSKKVRKLSNLGRAEWIAELGIARITKQGKFIQHVGHHNGEFFALYAEEALFLLDIGDLELCCNDVPMALQEAFSFVFGNIKSCCSFDEFVVYSNLVKRGYIVHRCESVNQKRKPAKRKHSSVEPQVVGEFASDVAQPSTSIDLKTEDLVKPEFLAKRQFSDPQDVVGNRGLAECREWFSEKNPKSCHKKYGTGGNLNVNVTFPNLADLSCTYLPAPDEKFIPRGIPRHQFTIEETWFQRLKRDLSNGKVDSKSSLRNAHSDIARRATNWLEYKEMLKISKDKNNKRLQKLDKKMQSGRIKPLLMRNDATSTTNVLKKIRILKNVLPTDLPEAGQANKFVTKFNVYQCGTTPFRKTDPGKPYCRIVVTNVQVEPPDFHAILSLLQSSKDCQVKFAVVDSGQVSYYTFDNAEIETLL